MTPDVCMCVFPSAHVITLRGKKIRHSMNSWLDLHVIISVLTTRIKRVNYNPKITVNLLQTNP